MTTQEAWEYISTHQEDTLKDVRDALNVPLDIVKAITYAFHTNDREIFDKIIIRHWADKEVSKNALHIAESDVTAGEIDNIILHHDEGGNGISDLM